MPAFSTWDQFFNWLEQKGLFHMNLGLERMNRALPTLFPEGLPFRVVQILGTNGKGSTAAFLASLAQSHGLAVGLFTSPHFVSPKERVLVDGFQLSDEAWLNAANAIEGSRAANQEFTYFEYLTIMALALFQEAKVDVAIMEAGLGGANDATTAIDADILCFAPIAMDHAAIIGPGMEDIARDKAAAIRDSSPVFSAPQFPAAKNILDSAAAKAKAPIHFSFPLSEGMATGLEGHHQKINASVALDAWRQLAKMLKISPRSVEIERLGLASAFLPGRMQFIPASPEHPALILDGAHNPHGVKALLKALEQANIRPSSVLFSCLGDKDWQSGLGMICGKFPDCPISVIQLDNSRAAKGEEVAVFCKSANGRDARIFSGPQALAEALEAAIPAAKRSGGPALICGSLYLLSEFFALYPEYLQPCA